jgi:hypothetical protein
VGRRDVSGSFVQQLCLSLCQTVCVCVCYYRSSLLSDYVVLIEHSLYPLLIIHRVPSHRMKNNGAKEFQIAMPLVLQDHFHPPRTLYKEKPEEILPDNSRFVLMNDLEGIVDRGEIHDNGC